jgi:ABC-2 type transport system permease protein
VRQLLRTTRFARALLVTSFKAALVLRGAFITQVVFMAVNNLTFFVFWWILMRQVPEIRGWRLAQVQVLFGTVAVAAGLAVSVAGGVLHLARLIDEGSLDALIVQPQPVLLHALGLRVQPSGLGDILSGLILIGWSGQVSWIDLPRVAMAIVTASLVVVASGVVFFSLPFWLGRVETLGRQLWDLLITFSVYPDPLFGGVLRLILFTLIPAGWVGYVPARVARDASIGPLLVLLAAAAIYVALALTIFRYGLRRYASGSRFATFG